MLGGTVATSSDLNGLPGQVGDGSEKEWEMQFFVNYGKGSMVTYSTLLESGWRNGATVRVLRRLAAAAISSRL